MVTTANDILALPLAGIAEAHVRIDFGGGELTVHPAEPGMLVSGTFDGGVVRKGSAGDVVLEPAHNRPFRPVRWDIGLTGEIPVSLRLDTGANRSTIDLTSLRIRTLRLETGASETTIRLPAGGLTDVQVKCGFAAVTIEVPPAMAARIHGSVTFGSLRVDPSRFSPIAGGWASPGADTAADRVDIAVEGGFGSVEIR